MKPEPSVLPRRTFLKVAASAAAACALPCAGAAAAVENEPESLRELVKDGKLPPMRERLPKVPKKIDFVAENKVIGRYGGRLKTLLGGAKDSRLMTVNEYARLIGFNVKLEIETDILERFDSEEDRVFTLKIRKGHRWSDGHPFTAEDFRYWWQDVATVPKLNEGAVDPAMVSGGKMPVFTILDDLTVRYEWPLPNPEFPLAIAGASPLFIFMPAHYMKQFNIRYADKEKLEELVRRAHVSDWAALHTRMGRMYRAQNPDLPTLEPWQNSTADATQRAVFKRNPYFHRVDPEGRQLPYIDEVILNFGSASIIPAETGAGQSDLQARYIQFESYTFLRQAEKDHDFDVRLWTNGISSDVALYPNLNVKDPAWKTLMNEARFRRALSIGLDRHELNEQLYFGLAKPGGNTVLRQSPLYKPKYDEFWTKHDPDRANRFLDNLGLSKRDGDGVRLMPDGRRMELVVESAGERTVETDAMELIRYHWADLGIKVYLRTLQRDLLRRRFLNGQTKITIGRGLDIGLATADSNPEELAPVSSAQPNWPVWGQYTETMGTAGKLPPIGPANRLLALYHKWRQSSTTGERREIWGKMLTIYADQVFSIGIAGETLQPVVVNRRLKNVPEKGLFSWQPTAFFGVYRPDTFFFEEKG
ncbi:MAG TPA: ABC transporter substrate-binding protein [Pararhizobium sp.]|nr:ABC transporter substrate-binding protein [Pararhizobium sp.]